MVFHHGFRYANHIFALYGTLIFLGFSLQCENFPLATVLLSLESLKSKLRRKKWKLLSFMIQGILKHDIILSQCLKITKKSNIPKNKNETFLSDSKTLWLYGKLLVSPPKKGQSARCFLSCLSRATRKKVAFETKSFGSMAATCYEFWITTYDSRIRPRRSRNLCGSRTATS